MRLAILTQYYSPEIGAPQARLSDLAQRLIGRGHEVGVLTAMPSYPGHKVHAGYQGRWTMREEIAGVAVSRVASYVPKTKTFLTRLLNYSSFALHASWQGVDSWQSADFLLTESPPLFLGPAGAYLARKLRAKFILNVSDLWPDSAVQLGFLKAGWTLEAARQMEEWCYRRADLITCQSETIVSSIRARFPDKRVRLLSNGVDVRKWQSKLGREEVRQRWGWPTEDFVVGYIGLHGHAQALNQVLDAAHLLQGSERIRFAFFGDGPCREQLIGRVAECGLSRVGFYAAQPHSEVPGIMAALDAALVPLARGPVFEGVRPCKLFEAMASGTPVVLAGAGEPERLVRAARCGVTAPPEQPALLADAIQGLSTNEAYCTELGENGRLSAAESFDRARIAGEFEESLLHMAGRNGS